LARQSGYGVKSPEAATSPGQAAVPWPRRRFFLLLVVVVLATVLLLARPAHQWLLGLFGEVERLIQGRDAWGMLLFVVLAALSAMLAFVSSAFLVPVAVFTWGAEVCFVLLWVGWFLGGLLAYLIGRYLGRPVVEALVPRATVARYEAWVHSGVSLGPILLLQLAVPSDVAGYVFGLLRCRFAVFVAALALAEVPYALGAVYLGVSFLERRLIPLLGLGAIGLLLSAWALRKLASSTGWPAAPGR